MYDDGSMFEGHFSRGAEEGLGRRISANLEYYYGNFDSGKPNGRGKSMASDGTYYEGNFVNGVPEGEGSENLVSGEKYTGSFRNGKRHGKGILIEYLLQYTCSNKGKQHEGVWRYGEYKGEA
eukprot:TRINITY_DN13064_c0_g1_i21.p1 TRINITY_DN13064_c0_g1~~TRINITY_DN13064_c0_g1_i21.p1  ORF type:complete len:122 (-),score=26.67 TRINITY_DN13064_c0_g1_i21:141-506(-)